MGARLRREVLQGWLANSINALHKAADQKI
jgi:hypothetical protein